MEKRSLCIFLGLALAHLSLAIAGASHLDLSRLGQAGRVLNYYGDLSGSGFYYGFFSPGVGFVIKASFEVRGADGKTILLQLDQGLSREEVLRVADIVDKLTEDCAEPQKLRRALTASLAGKIFSRYPDAQAVVVRIERFDPVSMKEFREGARAQWRPYYTAKFVRSRE
jgi:hypothetical protein